MKHMLQHSYIVLYVFVS